ncbi:AAEL009504-PA [Aedes aegypti]|uniref:AAEL009504-PA n=1 Tax=Aedes aegypti TaxID=7159 RepID=Q0IEL9_AEDAE|nr:AAEL009504-PA [Aedes aegypti]
MDKVSCGIWGCWPVPSDLPTTTTTVLPLLNDTTVEESTESFDAFQASIINILVAVVLVVEVCIVVSLLVLLKRSEGISREGFMSSWLLKINELDIQPDRNEDETTESGTQERLIQWVDEQEGSPPNQSELENFESSDDQELEKLSDSDPLVQPEISHKVQIDNILHDEK